MKQQVRMKARKALRKTE